MKIFSIIMSVKRKASSSGQTSKKHWSMGLLTSMKDPELIIKEDNKIVVIKDKYPKAQFHFLVIPKADIPSIWHVTEQNKNLLLHMNKVASDIAKEYNEHEFLIGYHAMPSMHRLHLHIISNDFNSSCLATKYHWNSFTTPFLMNSEDICRQLIETGEMQKIDSDKCQEYLSTPLKCHKCSKIPKNMPDLKKHLLLHSSQTK